MGCGGLAGSISPQQGQHCRKGLCVTLPRPRGHPWARKPPAQGGCLMGNHCCSFLYRAQPSLYPTCQTGFSPLGMCWSRRFDHHTLLLHPSAQQDCSHQCCRVCCSSGDFNTYFPKQRHSLYCQWIPGECLLQHQPLILTKWMSTIPNEGARNRLAPVFQRLAEDSAIIWEYCYYFSFFLPAKFKVIKLISF